MISTTLAERAGHAVAQRLRSLKGEEFFRDERPEYTKLPEDNLIPGLTGEDFRGDLEKGNGGELSDSPRAPAKFCAAHSSSALVVNSFGPFRRSPDRLEVAGYRGFTEARFERRCPTGLKGIPPNLDFFATGPEVILAVESKFLETLRPKKASFRESYKSAMSALAEPAWLGLYESLLENSARFTHLDAAQLLKHYLGIRNTFRDSRVPKVLFYLFWEPDNAASIPEFDKHRREVVIFSSEVRNSEIQFLALSYPELWQAWSAGSDWEGMGAHIEALRGRYRLSL